MPFGTEHHSALMECCYVQLHYQNTEVADKMFYPTVTGGTNGSVFDRTCRCCSSAVPIGSVVAWEAADRRYLQLINISQRKEYSHLGGSSLLDGKD